VGNWVPRLRHLNWQFIEKIGFGISAMDQFTFFIGNKGNMWRNIEETGMHLAVFLKNNYWISFIPSSI
jgi:hypothetical protein